MPYSKAGAAGVCANERQKENRPQICLSSAVEHSIRPPAVNCFFLILRLLCG